MTGQRAWKDAAYYQHANRLSPSGGVVAQAAGSGACLKPKHSPFSNSAAPPSQSGNMDTDDTRNELTCTTLAQGNSPGDKRHGIRDRIRLEAESLVGVCCKSRGSDG